MSASSSTSPSSHPQAPPLARPRHAAFTLIEVVVALTILSMITGTLFAIIQGSVRGASEIELLQRESDSIHRLLDTCRRTFSTLPGSATLTLAIVDGNASDLQELTITGSPSCFGFGIQPISYSDTTLSLRPYPDARVDSNAAPLHTLSLSRTDLIPPTEDNQMAIGQELTGVLAPDELGRHWMPLLPDVVSLKWRFYVQSEDTWYEEWSDAKWPDLVELQLLMRDRLTPLRMVFGLPVITLTAGRATPPSSAPPTTTSSTTPAPPTTGTPPTGTPSPSAPPAGSSR